MPSSGVLQMPCSYFVAHETGRVRLGTVLSNRVDLRDPVSRMRLYLYSSKKYPAFVRIANRNATIRRALIVGLSNPTEDYYVAQDVRVIGYLRHPSHGTYDPQGEALISLSIGKWTSMPIVPDQQKLGWWNSCP